MKTIIVIPARYRSERFPGKILAPINGEPMIRHVVNGVRKADKVDSVYVATDHEGIAQEVESMGVGVIKTATVHNSGTERILEAVEHIDVPWDFLINVQGDEPLISEKEINLIINEAEKGLTDIVTLACKIDKLTEVQSPNTVKVVMDRQNIAHYFSRSVIPYPRNDNACWYQHIGIYGFRKEAIQKIKNMVQSRLELTEGLEQLRWLDYGMKIGVAVTDSILIGVDVPEDIRRVEEILMSGS